MRDEERTELEPIDLPDLGELPGGPVFEWLAEHGAQAEEKLLEKRRRIALALEQSQWLEPMLARIEQRINSEIHSSGGQRFGRIHLHERDSRLGRLYSLTPLAKSSGVLRRWYLTYTIRIPGAPQRTLPLVVDLLVGGRALQLCIVPTEGLTRSGVEGAGVQLRRLHQFELQGVGIEGAQFAVIVEANAKVEGRLLEKVRLAIKDFQEDAFAPPKPKGNGKVSDEAQAAGRQFTDPRQMLP